MKAQVVELISLLEAGIDFAEDDVSVAPTSEILRRIEPVMRDLDALARSFVYGNLVRSGFSLAIAGRPNAGKSSLFNSFSGRSGHCHGNSRHYPRFGFGSRRVFRHSRNTG